jgi:uroporphyrinogen decarboxylase
MLETCLDPEIAAEITLQPVRRHKVDAAIFFSDIVIPLRLAGVDVEIKPGVGPVLANPVRTEADCERLLAIAPDALAPIADAVARSVAELGPIPLIGFGGAPFTVASYLIEGGPSVDLPHSRAMMAEQPELWARILTWCADVTAQFIETQVMSGASAIQVFDSWAGRLSPEDYEVYAKPYSTRLLSRLSGLTDRHGSEVPRVHFGVGTGPILASMLDAGATVMGIDSVTSLAEASELFDHTVPLQGNIATDILTQSRESIERHVEQVVEAGKLAPGHILNLGHGVPQHTDPDVLTAIVEHVHRITA